jgi:pimeloyl-ACP methyl ester carboxylesterase
LFVIQTQEVLDWYRDVVVPARAGADRGFWEKWRANWEFSFDVEGLLFEKPTLILAGRQDTHVGYLETWDILRSYPRATYVVLDRAGHALGVEQESLFRALFNEWLDRVEEHAANR